MVHHKQQASPPRGVVFDVDGTLYHAAPLRLIMMARLALAFVAHPIRTRRQMRILSHYRRAQEWLRAHPVAGRLTADSQALRTVETTGQSLEAVQATVRHWMEDAPLPWVRRCARRSLLRKIVAWHRMGVPLAVYSDYPAGDKLKALGLDSVFNVVVCSTEPDVGAIKPDPYGFEVAARSLGLPPDRLVYVGDRAEVDSLGASRAGMRCVLVGRWRHQLVSRQGLMTVRELDRAIQEVPASPGKPCWICGSTDTRSWRPSSIRHRVEAKSFRITDSAYGETAALAICRRCGFIFAEELPVPDLVEAYGAMDDPDYQAGASYRRIQMRGILDEAIRFHPQARTLLDIGAGVGLLTSEAAARGLLATGVEPSRWGVEVAARDNGVQLLCGTLEEQADHLGQYDLVMLVDVVEHVGDPLSLMRQGAMRLAPAGRMLVVTPDISSWVARLMGRRWWHHRVAHVGYFNRRSMRAAAGACGLDEVAHRYTGWLFSLSYILRRLERYVPFGLFNRILDRLARSGFASRHEVNINLHDSRLFIFKRRDGQ